ncbi:PhnD/SsuA/transferrin family substrate-binding protein [Salipiger mucosus]|uniref:Signal transduction histidine kinase n=1 Tax=Salipiger mucosus DSM 16094 TaxID=1123237 RepID=S9QM72_9RHOB|nr:PhnD/SsuA/transferrin family substrate-binding protein [Salipiger mucosus]EPX82556.1 Signal transduction histidine kinase [Salipiger mucosus DSM 16094]
MLAYRGWDSAHNDWQPLARYLSDRLGGRTVRLVPVTLSSAALLIETGAIQFLATNPGHYLTLAETYPMSVLATRARRLSDGSRATAFGSVLVARRGSGLDSYSDVAGIRLAAVSPRAFGGFQTAWYEAREQGIDLRAAPSEIVHLGFPMDRVVEAVLAGDADIGIVRSGLIEGMIREGRLDPDAIETLDPGASYTHPDAVSTRLWPEWPFAAVSGTDDALVDAVALALLQSAESELTDIWRAPVSYLPVRRLLDAYTAAVQPAPGPARALAPWAAAALVTLGLLALLALRFRHRLPALPLPRGAAADALPEVSLTRRERQVLTLVSRGLSSKEIATDLGISPKTVEFHRSNLLHKFDVRSAAQLVSVAGNMVRGSRDPDPT